MRMINFVTRRVLVLLVLMFTIVSFNASAFANPTVEGWGRYTPVGNSYKADYNKWVVPSQGAKIISVSNPNNADRIILVHSADGKKIDSEKEYYIKDLVGTRLSAGHYRFTPLKDFGDRYCYVSLIAEYLK